MNSVRVSNKRLSEPRSTRSAMIAQRGRLFSAEEYRARFQSAQTGMYRSLLVLLGLVAFWMAVENYYWRYVETYSRAVELEIISDEYKSLKANWKKENDSNEREEIRVKMADRKEIVDEIDEDVKQLKRESINFSMAGTTLPAHLTFAPAICLSC